MVGGHDDSLRFGHDGRDEGFVATLVMWPTTGKGLVVMTNGVSGGLLAEVTRAFEKALGLPSAPRVEKRRATNAQPIDSTLVGHYHEVINADTLVHEVRREGNVLSLHRAGTAEWRPLFLSDTGSFFTLENGIDYRFERGENGKVTALLFAPPLPSNAPSRRAVRLP
jgi:hypothetical protein